MGGWRDEQMKKVCSGSCGRQTSLTLKGCPGLLSTHGQWLPSCFSFQPREAVGEAWRAILTQKHSSTKIELGFCCSGLSDATSVARSVYMFQAHLSAQKTPASSLLSREGVGGSGTPRVWSTKAQHQACSMPACLAGDG